MNLVAGMAVVIVSADDPRNLGALIRLDMLYTGPLPIDQPLQTGWWLATACAPMAGVAFDDVADVQWISVGGTFLVNDANVMPLRVGREPSTVLMLPEPKSSDLPDARQHAIELAEARRKPAAKRKSTRSAHRRHPRAN